MRRRPSETFPVHPPFVGRKKELGRLRGLLESSVWARQCLILISGEPGIGKTRLALEMCARLEESGIKFAWGSCRAGKHYAAWQQIPRGVVRGMNAADFGHGLDRTLAEVAILVPEIREMVHGLPLPLLSSPGRGRSKLVDAVCRFLDHCASGRHLVLILDDVHLGSGDTLHLLARVTEDIVTNRLSFVVIYRDLPDVRDGAFRNLLSSARCSSLCAEVSLEGLSESEVGRLARLVASRPIGSELRRMIHASTRGNPLFVREVARVLQGSTDPISAHQWDVLVPDAVGIAITARLQELSPDARTLMERSSILGEEFSVDELDLLGMGATRGKRCQDLLAEAVHHGFLQESGGMHFRFSHSVVREAIRTQLPACERASVARTLAEAAEGRLSTPQAVSTERLSGWFHESGSAEAREKGRSLSPGGGRGGPEGRRSPQGAGTVRAAQSLC